ncbi:MAG: hypothetical protein ACF8AM_20830, partial [Rhodopirellula sp. JB055]|uniref:hypothetical protein n=1 Tax=Rhodopirellula sp. JB055 TaxID=3342846 RepID=UPI00370C62AA
FQYDDGIVRLFATATIVWGIVATLVGLIVAVLLVLPSITGGMPWRAGRRAAIQIQPEFRELFRLPDRPRTSVRVVTP